MGGLDMSYPFQQAHEIGSIGFFKWRFRKRGKMIAEAKQTLSDLEELQVKDRIELGKVEEKSCRNKRQKTKGK
jgi:hypothetical protein